MKSKLDNSTIEMKSKYSLLKQKLDNFNIIDASFLKILLSQRHWKRSKRLLF